LVLAVVAACWRRVAAAPAAAALPLARALRVTPRSRGVWGCWEGCRWNGRGRGRLGLAVFGGTRRRAPRGPALWAPQAAFRPQSWTRCSKVLLETPFCCARGPLRPRVSSSRGRDARNRFPPRPIHGPHTEKAPLIRVPTCLVCLPRSLCHCWHCWRVMVADLLEAGLWGCKGGLGAWMRAEEISNV
jgi:hypothetical protein